MVTRTLLPVPCFLAVLLSLAFWPHGSQSPQTYERTNVCGPIGVDTTWTESGNVYVLTCDVTVNAGVTLTIQPGVVVKLLDAWTDLYVNGKILAQGTAVSPVVFTSYRDDTHGGDTNGDGSASSPAPGDWSAVLINASSVDSVFSYAWFGYGGGNENASLKLATTRVTLQNNTFYRSSDNGIYLNGVNNALNPAYPFVLTGNSFITTTTYLYPVYANLENDALQIILQGNTSRGSPFNGFALSGVISGSLSLQADSLISGFSFVLPNDLGIPAGSQLTLGPGVVVKPQDQWDHILVSGSFVADGTPESPVVITSLRDDAHGGDTNNNGGATAPAPGDWGSFQLLPGSSGNVLSHAWLGYGYGDGSVPYPSGMLVVRSSDTRLLFSTFTQAWQAAVEIQSADPHLSGNKIQNNNDVGIYLLDSRPVFHFNLISGNTGNGVTNASSAVCLDAVNNDWGSSDGPNDASSSTCACLQGAHTSQSGEGVSDHVQYAPWLSQPLYFFTQPYDELLHGAETLAWGTLGTAGPASLKVDILASEEVQVVCLGSGLPGESSLLWDTHAVPDGLYTLTARFTNLSGEFQGEHNLPVLVNNSLVWHGGVLNGSQVWSAGKVHVVDGVLTLVAGAALSIESGAVVKFSRHARLVIQSGASLTSQATSLAPVVFTSLSDDLFGGDSNLNGALSQPQPGDWDGIVLQAGGVLNLNTDTHFHYLRTLHAGTLTASETWLPDSMHVILNDLTIPNGVTLTMLPGSIIKFEAKKSLLVAAGGQLLAQGTRPKPVYFTSLRDDAAGGDTNNDGSASLPAPGDWLSIYASGGIVDLNYAYIYYGGGSPTTTWSNSGMLRSAAGSTVQVNNSLLQDAFYDGVLAQGGAVTLQNSILRGADRGVVAWLNPVTIRHTTLYDNRIAVLAHGGIPAVQNSIIANSLQYGVDWDLNTGAPPLVYYSDVWGSGLANFHNSLGQPNPVPGTNGILSADPLFRDPAGGGFQPGFTSPVIDAADGGLSSPGDISGAPRYDDPRSPNTGIPAAGGAYSDMGAYEFAENAASDVDLVVLEVSGPASALAGETVQLGWRVANLGQGQAVGPWRDWLSLAGLPSQTPAEVMVANGLALGPGESAWLYASLRLPGGLPGAYRWQVQTNARGDVFEGVNAANNTGLSSASLALDLPVLAVDGGALSSQFGLPDELHWFKFGPSAGQDLLLELNSTAAAGASELYLSCGQLPTLTEYQLRSSEWASPDASLVLPGAPDQVCYLAAYARSLPAAPANFSVEASTLSFSLTGLSPSSAGNTGQVTLQIVGGKLAASMAYALVLPPNDPLPAVSVTVPDPAHVYATFDLSGAASGLYDLQVDGGSSGVLVLPGALEVHAGLGPRFSVQLSIPAAVRAGRAFDGLVTYTNDGDSDLISPLLMLSAGGAAEFRLDASQAFTGTTELQLLAAAWQGPAGILRPGQQGQIHFQARLLQNGTFTYQVTYKSADSSEPVDWAAFGSQIQPADMDPARWTVIWNLFTAQTGSTWGDYIQALAQHSSQVAARSGRFYSVNAVLQFALDSLYTQQYANLTGQLLLEPGQEPLGAQTVAVLDSAGAPVTTCYTLPDGYFAAELVPGTYTLFVDGYQVVGDPSVLVPSLPARLERQLLVQRGASLGGVILERTALAPLPAVTLRLDGSDGTLAYAVTDSAGFYTFDGLSSAVYTVTADITGYAQSTIGGLVLTPGADLTAADLTLDPAGAVSGRVTRLSDGAPIAGAVILFDDPLFRSHSSLSAADGTYTVFGLAPGSQSGRVEAPGYAPASLPPVQVAAGIPTVLPTTALIPGAQVDFTVLDASSFLPISNTEIILRSHDPGAFTAHGLTGSNGFLSLPHLNAAVFTLTLMAQDYLPLTTTLTLQNNDHLALGYYLHRAGQISGLVTAGGVPYADVLIQVSDAKGQAAQAFSDQSGQYLARDLPPGSYAVSLIGGRLRQEVVLAPDSPPQIVNFSLPGVRVAGKLLTGAGSVPVPDRKLLLLKDNEPVATARTASDGSFRFIGVANDSYTLAAGAGAGSFTPYNFTVAGVNLTLPDFHLGSLALTGSVRDPSGNLLENTTLLLLRQGSSTGAHLQVDTARSAADGSYQFGSLAAGNYLLQAHLAGKAVFEQPVSLSGPGAGVLNITLTPGFSVSGVVRASAGGLPVPGAAVSILRTSDQKVISFDLAGLDGYYRVGELPAGQYSLRVEAPEFMHARVTSIELVASSLIRNVYLQPTQTLLTVFVRDVSGFPVFDAILQVKDGSGSAVTSLYSNPDGSYSLDELPVGMYTLQVFANGYLPVTSGALSLSAGSASTQDFTLSPAATGLQPTLARLSFSLEAVQAQLDPNWKIIIDNPPAERQPGDYENGPEPPDPECLEAIRYYDLANKALAYKDRMFNAWNTTHETTDANVISSMSIFAIQVADLVASWKGMKIAPIDLMDDALHGTRMAQKMLYLGEFLVRFSYQVAELARIAASGKMSITDLVDLMDSFGTLSMDGLSLRQISNQFIELYKTMPLTEKLNKAFGWLSVATSAISLAADTYDSYVSMSSIWEATLRARSNYIKAWEQFQKRSAYVSQVNAWCKAGRIDPPPTPPYGVWSTGQTQTGVFSQDPNDKLTAGLGLSGYFDPAAGLLYTIRFENQSSATAPAQQVVIYDVLDPQLDWSTLELVAVGFNDAVLEVPPGHDRYEAVASVGSDRYPVRVQAGLDLDSGLLSWLIASYDPVTNDLPGDPFAGFLPPNDSAHRGEGYVTFKLLTLPGLPEGAQIYNQASILFDANAAILTNIVTNTLDSLSPVASVSPLPAFSPPAFTVVWSGSDAGAGLAWFDVYVSVDGGPFSLWQARTTALQAIYTGVEGHAYGFACTAADLLGHRQPVPLSAQASTLVSQAPPDRRLYLPLVTRH